MGWFEWKNIEGFISQVLFGYLGGYVKGIQRDQLKIGLWREEILLEKVELIPEAFDYLQLPFALKTGQVGKLSIKIPWKKFGRESIIVALEDVFLCTCQREDNEWSSDFVEKRELGGKLAKLNAIELTKFSKRVSDNPAGRSFLSFVYAKILDSIQISIKNVHVIYVDSHNNEGKFIFGLRLSTLTIMTDTQKQGATMSSGGKARSGQINKRIEISEFGFYCNSVKESPSASDFYGSISSHLCSGVKLDTERYDYLINPFDVSVSLLVNKSGKLDCAPQYSIVAEITALVLSLNDIQLSQMLGLSDYFSICLLRERYGRCRPSQISVSKKLDGWQRMWWKYAQESVLSDVRRKLRKTSWNDFGRRMSQCRRYVNLYKRKLELLNQEQLVNKDILSELEKMDKEYDIDDILYFRCVAEEELQEHLNSTLPTTTINNSMHVQEGQQISDQSESRARGWLNWLSLGMLGAGGTADSSSFAGAVSDEIIKDIYDATEFHPVPSFSGDSLAWNKSCMFSMKLNIGQVVSRITTGSHKKNFANAIFNNINIETNVREDSVAVLALVGLMKIINTLDDIILSPIKMDDSYEISQGRILPFIDIQVRKMHPSQNSELSIKVMVQPVEVTYVSDFFQDLIQFCDISTSFQSQQRRVLCALNGFRSFKSRVLSKKEYILSNRLKLNWHISLEDAVIKFPLKSEALDNPILVVGLGVLSFKSVFSVNNVPQVLDMNHRHGYSYEVCMNGLKDAVPFELNQDLYDHYIIDLTGFEVYILYGSKPGPTSVIDKMNVFTGFELCIIVDEPNLKALKVNCSLPSVELHLAPTSMHALVGIYDKLLPTNSKGIARTVSDVTINGSNDVPCSFQFSVTVYLAQLSLKMRLTEDSLNSSVICCTLCGADFRYSMQKFPECNFYVKLLKADELYQKGELGSRVIISPRNDFFSSTEVFVDHVGFNSSSTKDSKVGCFTFKHHAEEEGCILKHECCFSLSDVDLHIYPKLFGMLQRLFDSFNIQSYTEKQDDDCDAVDIESSKLKLSNNIESTISTLTLENHFPTATILDTAVPNRLESSHVSCATTQMQSLSRLDQQLNIQTPKMGRKLTTEYYATKKTLLNAETCNVYLFKINLNGLHIHFHDSSCILGTVSLSKSRVILSCDENECLDAHISTEWLTLSSCWTPPNIHKQLWGPASPNISPVLDIHVRKHKDGELVSATEIRFVIQHVCCILPPFYLSMLIGYFSLPDWTSDYQLMDDTKLVEENFGRNESNLSYKFEILHSRLLVPVESLKNFCPQLELPELCISFSLASKLLDSDKNIPSCCALPSNTNVDRFDIINVFGRTCSFSLVPLKDDTDILLKPDECSFITSISLMEQLDINIWIRVPCITMSCTEQSPLPALVMVELYNCNLFVEDKYLGYGVEAISSIGDEMTLIGEESKLFTCDVSQFLIIRKVLRDINAVTVETSNNSFINLNMCAKAISVKLSRAITQSTLSEKVAKADLQFNIASLVKGGILQSMEIGIPSLVLQSHSSNLLLASFVSDNSIGSSLCIKIFQSDDGNKQISVEVPFLDIWLHFLEWDNIIDALGSFSQNSDTISCSFNANQESLINDSSVSPCSVTEDKTGNVALTVKFESLTLAIHIPVCHKDNHASFEQEVSENCKYVQISLHISYCEFTECGCQLKLKCIAENIRTMLEMNQGQNIRSYPFIQISQIMVESSACKIQKMMHFMIDVQLESADIEFSYQILKFWSSCQLTLPDRLSSSSSYRHPSHAITCHVKLLKASVLLSDGRWSYHGPMFEILTKNTLLDFKLAHNIFEGSIHSDFLVNYNNIDKVTWESFIEPCHIHLNIVRKTSGLVILNSSTSTNLYLQFTSHLNLNITEPLIEATFRVNRMIDDAFNQSEAGGLQENQGVHGFQSANSDVHTQRYAPYILQNDTSLPFTYRISRGSSSSNDILCIKNEGNIVHPGHAVPIFVEELDEQYFYHRSAYSSERLIDKKFNSFPHHMISIQLEGTTGPSKLMSMDVVGLNYFEANFSINNKQSDPVDFEMEDAVSGFNIMSARNRAGQSGPVVPVVFEVSMQHYSKMIRVYSTVILSNATSMPLELRFDIPFGFSPKVLDPILPGQEIPLPLHLAESGQIRWRPLGNKYLWSEAHSLSNIVSQEYRLKFLRSFVCYPVHPTSNPFRCCISIQDYSLSASNGEKKQSFLGSYGFRRGNVIDVGQSLQTGLHEKHSVRLVRLTTPLLVKNYLPVSFSLMIESGGVTHTILVKEVDVVSVSLVDSTNDLGMTFHMQGYRPAVGKFPRAESFSSMAKLNGSVYYVSETLALYPETSSGPTHVTLEKAMDASSGAREICLFVPFLVYNCTGLVLSIVDSTPERKGNAQVIPSSYPLIEHEHLLSGKQGLPFLSSMFESCAQNMDANSHTVSIREKSNLYLHNLLSRNFYCPSSPGFVSCGPVHGASFSGSNENANSCKHAELSEVKPHMYSPTNFMRTSESMVKLCAHISYTSGNALCSIWSNPFSLLPASGSVNVNIPKPNGFGAFLISATSIPISGQLTGRSRAIIFQPRYVICNTCNKDLSYKQKGTNDCYHLSSGQHSHLHLSDTSRELYVSIRFNEPGSQWSGSFLPDFLGDVQLKVRNYISGRLHMVRVEIQNADMAGNVENTIKSTKGISSTQLIILSDDDSGYMPYRIDNFSMERLRVYQQRCEFFETIINSYSSTQYAWDEPCNPHRLVIEVPGERILGIYTLDNIQDYQPIYLPSTAEKSERRLFVSVHGEGATKVLSIVDSNFHLIKDNKETALFGSKESKKTDKKLVAHANYSEIITIHVPFIGISLVNSSPQELLYVSARDSTISVMQNLDEQRLSFQISNLQIDNQFFDTPYPILVSFNNEHRGGSANFQTSTVHDSNMKNESGSPSSCSITNEYVFYFSAAKWKNVETSLVSFRYISLRLAPSCIELEEQVLLSTLEFFRSVSARLQSRNLQNNVELHNLDAAGDFVQLSADRCDHEPIYRGPNNTDSYNKNKLLPSIIPVGAPWQNICLSARRKKKIYIELFEVSPIKFSFSFTSTPWVIRNEDHTGVDNIAHISSSTFLRSLMALVDVEEVPVHLGELVLGHLMASPASVEEIITTHYTRQLLHEMYKIFGSAGVIGNPIGFARNVALGIKDFLSVSRKENVWSPIGLLNGITQGSKSLITNTVYAISSATTQFTKTAHKGIVAFTFDEQAVAEMDTQLKDSESHGKGILSEFLEGLTGLLQSPIRGAERHGLPGVLSGIAMGTAGVVARPMASILEATGKTAQNIRKRSSPHQANRLRIRLPRPLARELPLLPYSWEEAIGVSMLLQADRSRLKDETLLMCKSLKQPGKFTVISEIHVLCVFCSSLIDLGSPQFAGVCSNPEWVIEMEMELESIVHIDRTDDSVNIVGSNAESSSRSRQMRGENKDSRRWKNLSASLPLVYMKLEHKCGEEAEDVLRVLLSMIDQGKERRQGKHVLHRSNLR